MVEIIKSKIKMLETENSVLSNIQEHIIANINESIEAEKMGIISHKEIITSFETEINNNAKYFLGNKDNTHREIFELMAYKKNILKSIDETFLEIILQKKHSADKKKLTKLAEKLIELMEGFKQYNKKLISLMNTL